MDRAEVSAPWFARLSASMLGKKFECPGIQSIEVEIFDRSRVLISDFMYLKDLQ